MVKSFFADSVSRLGLLQVGPSTPTPKKMRMKVSNWIHIICISWGFQLWLSFDNQLPFSVS